MSSDYPGPFVNFHSMKIFLEHNMYYVTQQSKVKVVDQIWLKNTLLNYLCFLVWCTKCMGECLFFQVVAIWWQNLRRASLYSMCSRNYECRSCLQSNEIQYIVPMSAKGKIWVHNSPLKCWRPIIIKSALFQWLILTSYCTALVVCISFRSL